MIKAAILGATGYTGAELVRLLPPLTVTSSELEEGLIIIKQLLEDN